MAAQLRVSSETPAPLHQTRVLDLHDEIAAAESAYHQDRTAEQQEEDIVRGTAVEGAVLEQARVLVQEHHVHQEVEAQPVYEEARHEAPQLESSNASQHVSQPANQPAKPLEPTLRLARLLDRRSRAHLEVVHDLGPHEHRAGAAHQAKVCRERHAERRRKQPLGDDRDLTPPLLHG